ncbi:LysR family transcriptional regulator [Sinorhizobium sp. 8-89]|uniref:helix-turn-helix domain-containing protein n=1 Tax=Sinorhizobium sp. 8-89 TaxID=3049089 RepID=UPI003868926F
MKALAHWRKSSPPPPRQTIAFSDPLQAESILDRPSSLNNQQKTREPLWTGTTCVFLAVARTGSLSAATRELGASQATIGRRVQAFENAWGAVLFERLNTGYVLTSAGREIQARAEAAEAAVLAVTRGVDKGQPKAARQGDRPS